VRNVDFHMCVVLRWSSQSPYRLVSILIIIVAEHLLQVACDILNHLSFCELQCGRFEDANRTLDLLLSLEPECGIAKVRKARALFMRVEALRDEVVTQGNVPKDNLELRGLESLLVLKQTGGETEVAAATSPSASPNKGEVDDVDMLADGLSKSRQGLFSGVFLILSAKKKKLTGYETMSNAELPPLPSNEPTIDEDFDAWQQLQRLKSEYHVWGPLTFHVHE
jgi:hypothetical protein